MIDFFTKHIKIILGITITILVIGFLPEVTQLPFGLDNIITIFVQMMHGILALVDILRVPWYLFLAGLAVEMAFFLWKWVNYFLQIYLNG